MAELKSALLFGVTIHFKIEMGANSPGLIWFGLVWLGLVQVGLYGLDLSYEKEIFQQENIIVTTPTQLQPQHNLT